MEFIGTKFKNSTQRRIYRSNDINEAKSFANQFYGNYFARDNFHPTCKEKCQETEGFIGTEHEGVSVCDDGCVLADAHLTYLIVV